MLQRDGSLAIVGELFMASCKFSCGTEVGMEMGYLIYGVSMSVISIFKLVIIANSLLSVEGGV